MSWRKYPWWGYVKAIIRAQHERKGKQLAGAARREYEAVENAVNEALRMNYGALRVKLVDMVFWSKTHTLQGAALALNISEHTAQRWHANFIKSVAVNMGILDADKKEGETNENS